MNTITINNPVIKTVEVKHYGLVEIPAVINANEMGNHILVLGHKVNDSDRLLVGGVSMDGENHFYQLAWVGKSENFKSGWNIEYIHAHGSIAVADFMNAYIN